MATDFQNMIGRFGTPVTIRRSAPGAYNGSGEWTPGSTTDIPAKASIQPARGAQLEFLPSAQRTGEEMIAFFDTQVYQSESDSAEQSDLILWNSEEFKVLVVKRWEMIPTQVYWEAVIQRSTQL